MVSSCCGCSFALQNTTSLKASNYTCAIFNIVLAIPTSLLNFALIIAIHKSNEEKQPCQIMVLNLALTDFSAGIFGMPSIFFRFLHVALQIDSCNITYISLILVSILGHVSLQAIVAIAIERYMYVFKPFMHSTRLTPKLTYFIVSCEWLYSIALVTSYRLIKDAKLTNTIKAIVLIYTSIIIVYCYTKIFLRSWGVRQQIQTEAARFGQQQVTQKERNLLLIGGFIIISFFVCYSFYFATSILELIEYESDVFHYTICWAWTFAMANSLFNPLISCIFNSLIRRDVLRILTCGYKQS